MSLSVRNATEDDLESIYKIESECFSGNAFTKQQLEHLLRSKVSVTLIALLDGEPVGFIAGSVRRSKDLTVCHIYTLDVKRNCRRRGVGTSLLDSLERVMAEKGARTCYLETRINNAAAQSLYKKHGYRLVETLRDYYGFEADGLRFKKELS